MIKPLLGFSILVLLIVAFAFIIAAFYAKRFYIELNESRLYPIGQKIRIPTSNSKLQPIILLGDSRAYSWDLEGIPEKFTLINKGVNGFTSEQLKLRLQTDTLDFNNSVVLIQVGINDLKTISIFSNQKEFILMRTMSNIRRIILKCFENKASKVIVTTVFPLGKLDFLRKPFWSDEINSAILNINKEIKALNIDHVIIFDAYSILEDKTKKNGWGNQEYYDDFLHLNKKGYLELDNSLKLILKSTQP